MALQIADKNTLLDAAYSTGNNIDPTLWSSIDKDGKQGVGTNPFLSFSLRDRCRFPGHGAVGVRHGRFRAGPPLPVGWPIYGAAFARFRRPVALALTPLPAPAFRR